MIVLRKFLFAVAAASCIACNESSTPAENHEDSVGAAIVDTVNSPRVVTSAGDGSLLLTAETGRGLGPAIKYMPEWRAFGWFTSEDSVAWDVDVKDAGQFEVELEWSVDDGEAGKEFLLRAGSRQLTGKVGKSGSWETFKKENIGSINLAAGQQQIVFKSNQSFHKDSALLDLRGLHFRKK